MPALDHTKSLAAYKDILETFERDYRDSSTDQRPHIMDAISGSIAAGAEEQGATILSGDALEKVSQFFLPSVILLTYHTL
jgi:hypothetical protein